MSLDYFSHITDNSKVYRVIFNKVTDATLENPNSSLENMYTRLNLKLKSDDVSTIPDIVNLEKDIESLHKSPENISQWLFLFIGVVENEAIQEDLKKIMKNKNFNESSEDLDNYFGYNVANTWQISEDFEKIIFVNNLINPEDNINYLNLFISSVITKYTSELEEPIVCDAKSILLHSDDIPDCENIINHIIKAILYEHKIKTYQFNIQYLKKKLETFNIPRLILDTVFEKFNNDIVNIVHILNNNTIKFFIKLNISFKPLLHQLYLKNSNIPINTYIPFYFNIGEPKDYSQKKFRTTYNNSKNIIKNLSGSNTIYFYTLNNFLNTLSQDSYENSYKNFLKILFPKILYNEYGQIMENYNDPEYVLNNIINIHSTLSNYLLINEMFYKYTKHADNSLNVKYAESFIVKINYKFKFPLNFDLRYIFNDLILSYDIPFSKYRDIQGKDVLYKIYKPITKRAGIQYLPLVDKEKLYNWIKYKNFEIDNYKVKNIRGYPKELFLKLKLFDYYDQKNILREGQVVKINNIDQINYFDIRYNDTIFNSINSDYVFKTDGTVVNLEDIVNFYNKQTLYADIEIFKKGITTISINTTIMENLKFNNPLFIDKITDRINYFIEKIYSSNKLLTSFRNIQETIPKNSIIKSINNKFKLNFKVEVTNNQDYSYSLLTTVFKNLYPLVYLQSETLQVNDIIEFYDEDLSNSHNSNIWIKGIIKGITGGGLYNLELHDENYKEYTGYVNKKDVINLLIRKEGIDRTYIKLLFKKVVNFEETKPLKNFIIKSLELGIDKDEILERITERFSKTSEEANKELVNISEESSYETLNGITTPVITIDYMNRLANLSDKYIANILVENVSNYETANLILKFIEFSFDIYNLLNPNGFNNPSLAKLSTIGMDTINEMDKDIDEVLNSPVNSDLLSPQKIDEEDFFDFDVDFDDEDEEDLDDIELETDYDNISKKLDLESITITKSNLTKNVILERLYETDPSLFFWESNDSDKTRYSRTCQSVDRYPKVFTQKQKNLIDQRDIAHFTKIGMNPNIRSYSTKNSDNSNCDNLGLIAKMKNPKCSAVKYGSDVNKQNWKHWYTCPRIYDMYENVPLHYTMLSYNHPTIKGNFIPLDYEDITNGRWRTHIDGKTDILKFNPTYKGRGVITESNKIIPTRTKSLILLPGNSEYSYPGFMSGTKHPEGLFAPCCYKGTNKNIGSALGISKNWTQTYNSYIQGVNKELGYLPRRIGIVPNKILSILGRLNSKCITGDMTTEKKCFFRFGNKQGSDSFLNYISDLYRDTLDSRIIKNYIVENLNYSKFKTINNGLLEVYFRNYGKQSSLQNFFEYTLSEEYKDYKFYYELFTERSRNLKKLSKNRFNGLIIIIFDVSFTKSDSQPNIDILCPYFSNNTIKNLNMIDNVSFVIKKGNVFEPIYYFDGNTTPKKIFSIKSSSLRSPYIMNLVKTFIEKSNEFSNSEIIDVARHLNKHSFDRKYNLIDVLRIFDICKTKNWENEYGILAPTIDDAGKEEYRLLVDSSNRIFGVFLGNNSIVPIYPEVISERYLNSVSKNNFKLTKISIDQRISYNNTTLDNHLQTYALLKNLSKSTEKPIEIFPVKYFIDENGFIEGFLTNIGIYLTITKQKIDNYDLELITSNYDNVDKELIKYENLVFSNTFTELPDIIFLNNIVSSLDKSSKDKFTFTKYYIEKDNVFLLETIEQIYIPVKPIRKNKFIELVVTLNPIFQKITLSNSIPLIRDLENYKKLSNNLYKISEYNIPLKLSGSIMNIANKNIEKIYLESGTEINLENTFKINKFEKGEFVINNLINDTLEYEINKKISITKLNFGLRETIIDKINYDDNIYNAIRFMLYNLLQKDELINLKIYLEKIINAIDLSISIKRKLIYPFFNILFRLIINPIEKSDINYPIINIDNLCDFDKCIGSLCTRINIPPIEDNIDFSKFLWKSYSLINTKLQNKDYLNRLLSRKKIISNSDLSFENLIRSFTQNIDENISSLEKNNIGAAVDQYNLLASTIPRNMCKLNIIDEDNRIEYIKYRVIEELLRNSYSKSQIFENFKQINLDEKFKFNLETEILLSEKELKDKNILNNLYLILKKNYYRELTNFDDMEYKINIELLRDKSLSSRDSINRCTIGNKGVYKVKFVTRRKKNKNNSVSSNKKKLNSKQYLELLDKILKLNTTLTKKQISKKGIYKVKKLEQKKNLNR